MEPAQPIVLRATFQSVAMRTGVPFGVALGLMFGALGAVGGGLALLWTGPCAVLGALLGFVAFGLVLGGVSGAVFGATMAAAVDAVVASPPPKDWDDGERVVAWGPCNRRVGWEGVGGRLFLTNRRLRFVSHGLSVQKGEGSWPLASIGAVTTAKTWGLVDNQLVVATSDGPAVLLVEAREEWVALLAKSADPEPLALPDRAGAPSEPRETRSTAPTEPGRLAPIALPTGTSVGPTLTPGADGRPEPLSVLPTPPQPEPKSSGPTIAPPESEEF